MHAPVMLIASQGITAKNATIRMKGKLHGKR
jgi:hypothetical protein